MNPIPNICKSRLTIVLAGLALALSVIAAYGRWNARADPPSFRTTRVTDGSITAIVAASGTLNPANSVQVGSQVSGQIKEVLVDFNSEVKKIQIIARLDPDVFEFRMREAQADLDSARAAVITQHASITALRTETLKAKIGVDDAERTLSRNDSLFQRSFFSSAQFDKSRTALVAARQQVDSAIAQLEVGASQVRNLLAQVRQREAVLEQARLAVGRTIIRSPVDGVVIQRSIEAGQTVAASLQAPVLFTIARDLSDMQVETLVDEADVGRIRVGEEATFTVDAFPGRRFSSEVKQIRKAPQVQQNVVTFEVLITARDPNPRLSRVNYGAFSL